MHARNRTWQCLIGWIVTLWSLSAAAAEARLYDTYAGNYRVAGDHIIGINPFIMDDGTRAMLIADYSSGVVRRLFSVSSSEFVMGPGFNTSKPAELTVRFTFDSRRNATAMSLQQADGKQSVAERVALKREEVSFKGIEAQLAGTLILPPGKGPHPAIILLHGSGPLTRYSFGPYPNFFSSLGLAVMIYDKRGTGNSNGLRLDASTGNLMSLSKYPDQLAGDALAAMRFLQERDDIDPKRIGFWGSSEGGMLTTQVAARSQDVAFAINSSGFMEPLWQTLEYQIGAIRRQRGSPPEVIEKERAFFALMLRVGRTGKGFDEFLKAEEELAASGHPFLFRGRGPYTFAQELLWDWDHILSFDPLPGLARVRCPVLGLFGEEDILTPAARTSENMRRVLTQAGHKDFTLKVFPRAGHSLSERPDGKRMAPGVFETLRSWLKARL